MTAAAVAGCLAHAARQRGGMLMGTAAELHKLGSGDLWPRSALELERVQLPDLARRAGHAGCTVQSVGGATRGVWHVRAAPLPRPALAPAVRPIAAAAVPKALPRAAAVVPVVAPRQAAAPAVVSQAEYEMVRQRAAAERYRLHWERHDRARNAERAKEHAENLAFLAAKGRTAA